MTNGYDESIAAHDGTKLVGFGPRRFDATHSRAVIDAETCTPEEAEYWGVYRLDSHGLPPHALGRPEYVAQRPDRAGAREFAEQWAERLDQGRALAYAYDTHILDAAGHAQVSYGPRRLESDAPDAHVESCLPAEAAFWGVYQHDAEGLAAIVGDAHDEPSAKAFAEQVARVIELEARLTVGANAMPRVVLVMERERIQNIVADTAVEVVGLNYNNDEIDEAEANGLNVVEVPQGDGTVERAVVGSIPVEVDPEEAGRLVGLNVESTEKSRSIVLAIDTNTAAFKDLGCASEVARLLRDAGAQLQTAPDLDCVRLVDTNDNEVGWLFASDISLDLESPGMVNLVVDTGEDHAFGTTEADRMALANAFLDVATHLARTNDLAERLPTFTVDVKDPPHVIAGRFHYVPALEPEVQRALEAAGAASPEI